MGLFDLVYARTHFLILVSRNRTVLHWRDTEMKNLLPTLPYFLVGTLVGGGGRCATSWCDLDLTFDLAVVTLTYKILSGLYLGNRKV